MTDKYAKIPYSLFIPRNALKYGFSMIKIIFLILTMFSAYSFIIVNAATAEIYKYRDRHGTECFTDNFEAIPQEYRRNAVIDRSSPGQESGLHKQQQGQPSAASTQKGNFIKSAKRLAGSRLFQSIVLSVCFVLLMYLAGMAGKRLDRRRVFSLLKALLTCLLFVYFFYAYSNEVNGLFDKVRNRVSDMKRLTDERGKAIDEITEPGKKLP
jgi:hypothetical protein